MLHILIVIFLDSYMNMSAREYDYDASMLTK